jgi:hypothetical protein
MDLTTPQRAKLIKSELKANFPATKFSVKTINASMMSDVLISWTCGPTEEMVTNVVECLTDDMKNLYETDLNSKICGISYDRSIPVDVWDTVRSEVMADLEETDHPFKHDSYRVDQLVSRKINHTNF